MELYRVLLVDDEEDIREGISRKMDWLGLGFSLVGEAANGQDALELAESLRPDVILTDIKMPFMDGLELCRILTDRLPAARFVVFSGFDAFEYAKQAIQMNVVEYILKPINADELSAVLRRLKDQLDRERAERRNVELLRSRYMENLPVLRELFYANLLDGRIEPGTERERAAHLDIDLQGEEWAVGLAYIGSDRRDALSTLSIQNLLEETLTADRCKLSLYNDWVAVIVSLTESFTIYDLIRVLDRELIFPGPRERHGADALTLQLPDARQVPRERAAVLHAQKGRRLPRRPRALHVGYRAAGRHPIRKVLHLALKIFTRCVEKADCLLPAQAVRQENGEKLRPVHILWEV